MQDDEAAQQKEIQWFSGKPEENLSLNAQLAYAAILGQRGKAKELRLRLLQLQRRAGTGNANQPALTEAQEIARAEAGTDAVFGICEAARKEKMNTPLCPDAAAERLRQEEAAKNPAPNPDTTISLFRRGKAALEAGKGAEAAVEFQKIVDHKGRNWGVYYGTAHLFLARAQAKAGDTAKAKRAYQDFLTLWKDADKDLPFYIQAKKELAELR
jgi:TolA-binding protein